jgi:hypothetical protein
MDGSYLSSSGDGWKYCGVATCCVVMVLTDGIRRALQDGAASLKGYARRLFMARTVRDFGPGGQRFAEKELGWNRRTIRMGAHELRTGVECVASQSQTAPRFESERVYCRLPAEANRKCWFERSVTDERMKFGVVVQRVRSPLGQSLASRPVASLAVDPVTGRLMRR